MPTKTKIFQYLTWLFSAGTVVMVLLLAITRQQQYLVWSLVCFVWLIICNVFFKANKKKTEDPAESFKRRKK